MKIWAQRYSLPGLLVSAYFTLKSVASGWLIFGFSSIVTDTQAVQVMPIELAPLFALEADMVLDHRQKLSFTLIL